MNDSPSSPISKSTNIVWHKSEVSTEMREKAYGQKGVTLWFTGLSGSGKSTVANRVEKMLVEQGRQAYVLDGDNIRHGLNQDLNFSPEDRVENIRRIGEVAKLFTDAGLIVVSAFISPYRKDRERVRQRINEENATVNRYVEVHVATPLEVCEQRDPKGLYKKARAGEISNFTGISAPYEAPTDAEITIDTSKDTVDGCADAVIKWLQAAGYLNAIQS